MGQYWGLDVKPKKGRLKIDSVRVLQQSGWPQNVIDVDTYGAPWKHWEALLPWVTKPVTVFLTIGKVMGASFFAIDKLTMFYLGLHQFKNLPPSLGCILMRMSLPYALSRALDLGLEIVEAVEAVSDAPHARYVGVRVQPKAWRARTKPRGGA